MWNTYICYQTSIKCLGNLSTQWVWMQLKIMQVISIFIQDVKPQGFKVINQLYEPPSTIRTSNKRLYKEELSIPVAPTTSITKV